MPSKYLKIGTKNILIHKDIITLIMYNCIPVGSSSRTLSIMCKSPTNFLHYGSILMLLSVHGSRYVSILELPHPTFSLSSRSIPYCLKKGARLVCTEVHFLHWLNSPDVIYKCLTATHYMSYR